MKALAVMLLAIALVFGAAPLCAAPAKATPMAAIPDCADMAADHDQERDSQRHDPTPACHSCAAPPGVAARIGPTLPWVSILPVAEPIGQLTGAALEPPTPPPRVADSELISTFQRS